MVAHSRYLSSHKTCKRRVPGQLQLKNHTKLRTLTRRQETSKTMVEYSQAGIEARSAGVRARMQICLPIATKSKCSKKTRVTRRRRSRSMKSPSGMLALRISQRATSRSSKTSRRRSIKIMMIHLVTTRICKKCSQIANNARIRFN